MTRSSHALACVLLAAAPQVARAQQIDMSKGGPIEVTAANGLQYDQSNMTLTAQGDARATRGDVTVLADQMLARLRKKAPGAAKPAPQPKPDNAADGVTPEASGGQTEIYRLEATGNVRIFTPTDQVDGANKGIYDIDQAVLILTGPHLKLTTPQQVMTARDTMEYWSQRRMAVGRGDAVVTTTDGRRIAADTLVGFTSADNAPAKAKPEGKNAQQSGKLQRVEAYGHVVVRTATETVTGDRGVYVPDDGIARLMGHVHITRGLNQLNGAEAIVNMKTGISTLSQTAGGRVHGLVVPNTPAPAKDPAPEATSGTTPSKDHGQ